MVLFLYIVPLKQGLKREFIPQFHFFQCRFLYIVPLKQGLKPKKNKRSKQNETKFLYIVPLKQGLKLLFFPKIFLSQVMFLYIVPLKQGLKPFSRIQRFLDIVFLYIVPLKQGLKLNGVFMPILLRGVFIHSSIKTRIETLCFPSRKWRNVCGFYT